MFELWGRVVWAKVEMTCTCGSATFFDLYGLDMLNRLEPTLFIPTCNK